MSRSFLTPFTKTTRRATVRMLLCAAAVLAPWASAMAAPNADIADDDDDGEENAPLSVAAAVGTGAGTASASGGIGATNANANGIAGAGKFSRDLSALQIWAENDLGWSDRYYTSGLKIAYTTPEVFTDGLPLFFKDLIRFSPLAENNSLIPAAYRLHLSLVHEFYTPKEEYLPVPPRNDHPYAGIFYGTFGVSSETATRLDALEFGVGVIGPSANARQGQNSWHRFIGARLVNGWNSQLRDEPFVQFSWTRAGRYNWLRDETFAIEWLPRFHLDVGTVRDYVAFGSQWRIGWNLPHDFGSANIRTSSAFTRPDAHLTSISPVSWKPDAVWFFLDAQVEGWVRNAVLDGNAWHDSASVHRNPFVGEFAFGFATQWGGLRVSIAEVLRTKEFRGQSGNLSNHTTLSLSYSF